MSWTDCGIVILVLGVVITLLCTVIPQRHPRNQRVPGVLPPPSCDCERRYVP